MHNQVAGLKVSPVNTGLPPSERIWPDGRTSEEMFGNQKAEVWWLCRTALQRTHEHVLFLEGKGGKEHPVTDLLALPSGDPTATRSACSCPW
jgi:phage terminase large subunit